MKQVKYRNSASKLLLLGTVFLFSLLNPVFAQEEAVSTEAAAVESAAGGDVAKGEALFKSLCAACHKRYKKMTGPALFGVTERRDTEWLYSWIKNSAAMIASGDADAIAIFEEYKKTPMNAFPQLTNTDIDNILAYVMVPKADPPPPPPGEVTSQSGGSGVSSNLILAA